MLNTTDILKILDKVMEIQMVKRYNRVTYTELPIDKSPFQKFPGKKHFSLVFYEQAAKDGYRYAVRLYRPSYITGYGDELVAVNCLDDVFKLEHINKHKNDENTSVLVLEEYASSEQVLNVKTKNGESYVIAFVQDLDRIRKRQDAENLYRRLGDLIYVAKSYMNEDAMVILHDVQTYIKQKESY